MKLMIPALISLIPLLCSAQALAPERQVHDNRLVSQSNPAVEIRLPRAAHYLGADRWNLYDIADAELHVFVEADRDRIVKALYWIQFEGYLPSNAHTYDYTRDEPVTFAGRPFWQRATFGSTGRTPRAGSDTEHVRNLVHKAGFRMPAETMNLRLVHLLDDAKRQELMFIYAEDLASSGYTSAQLLDGDQPRPEWEPVKKALVERAMKRIRVRF